MQRQYFWKYGPRSSLGSFRGLHRDLPMRSNETNVIDFTLHRKRRQARAAAELMWAMYIARAGLAAFTTQSVSPSSDTRRA